MTDLTTSHAALLESCQELVTVCAACCRVIAANHCAAQLDQELANTILDGFGVRAQQAIAQALELTQRTHP